MAQRGAMPDFATIDDYISTQPKEAQKILKELRSIIREAVPGVVEVQNYKVPVFTLVQGKKVDSILWLLAMQNSLAFILFLPQ